jgi:hypothetical protein
MQQGEHQATIHFHIHWPDKLDWERFETREDAFARAGEIVQPGESYSVETFDDLCPVCQTLSRRFAAGRRD